VSLEFCIFLAESFRRLTPLVPAVGTGGLGRASLLALARHAPRALYFTGRNARAAAAVEAEIRSIDPAVNVVFLHADHSSLSSVENATKQFLAAASPPRLDALVCNAGVMAKDPALTTDGYEWQFGINHMSHALMVKMLLPTIEHTNAQTGGGARIVFITSAGFRWTPAGGIVFPELKTTQDYWFAGRWVRYGQSKLANLVYAQQLASRYPNACKTVSIHPGSIRTGILDPPLSWLNRVFVFLALLGKWSTIEEGIANTCWTATTESKNIDNGAFYEWTGVKGGLTPDAERQDLADELWKWTQKELTDHGY